MSNGVYDMDGITQNIAVGVLTDLTKDAVKAIGEKIKEYCVDLSEKGAIDFGYAYEKYLITAYEKIGLVKTIIYRKEPKNLCSIYECLNVRISGQIVSTEKVDNLLDHGHKLIITGTAGIGKTTLLRHLFLNSCDTTNLVPIFVELRSVNSEDVKDISILDLIYSSLVNQGFDVPKEYFSYSMEAGRYIILYDGYDEVKVEKNLTVSRGIRELSTKYPDNYYIVSSRPMEQFIGWNDFNEGQTMVLDKKQAISLIKKIEYDKNTKQKFLEALENGMFEKYYSFASNPLLLNIMLMTFDERAEIPDKLNDFYEQAFATLFNVHDGYKDCFKRDIRSGLGCEDFKKIFSYFCFKSYFKGDYQFTESSVRKYILLAKEKFDTMEFEVDDYLEDLIKSVCMLVKEGLGYVFSHRSFQEYFAAYYTTKLVDNEQTKLLTSWLVEKKGYADDPYFLMLYNMQGEKFNRIILAKALKKLKQAYKSGFTFDFLKTLFYKISVTPKSGMDRGYYSAIFVKDNYLCATLRMACIFNNFEFKKGDDDEEFISYVTDKRTLKEQKEISLEKIEEDNMVNACLNQFKWIEKQVEFSLALLNKIDDMGVMNKRKVDSIIDSL